MVMIMNHIDKVEVLQQMINDSRRIVFFGGAGVSTESGLPDFRSVDGLYAQKYQYPPETMLSRSFFDAHPQEFFGFYRDKLLYPDAKPNAAHHKLVELERAGRLLAVISQNIDGLHQAAGSQRVLELHGSVHRNSCMRCGKAFGLSAILESSGVPHCSCGGVIKPDVVLYEEGLDPDTMHQAAKAISQADLLMVGGTSLAVYPAAGLVDGYKGHRLVLINKEANTLDTRADLVIHGPIGQMLGQIRIEEGSL
jgi:NAD-dependent deacetylase